MSLTSFCWWCGGARLGFKHLDPADDAHHYTAVIHDGHEVTVHKNCAPYAEEWVRQSRMTASEPEYYNLTQSHQLALIDKKLSDPRRGKKGTDAKDH